MQHVVFQLAQTVSTIHQVSALPHCKYVIIFIIIIIIYYKLIMIIIYHNL